MAPPGVPIVPSRRNFSAAPSAAFPTVRMRLQARETAGSVCNEAGDKTTPLRVINGQRYTGTQSLDALAQYSQYKSAGGKP